MMDDRQTQLTSDSSDQECFLTVIPSPNPLEGQEIQDYLNQNSLTIVDIGKVENLKKQLVDKMDLLNEFKVKEKKWMEENAELKQQVTKLEFRKKFIVAQHGKMLECVRKIANVTEFHRLKQSPSKENSNCEFEFVREELLVRFSKHVEEKFEEKKMKKDAPVCDDKLVETEPVSVPAVVVSSPKHSPTPMPTMSVTSGSGSTLEKERQKKVKINLFPSAPEPCDDEAPKKPAAPKLVIKAVKGQQSGVKPQGTLPSSSDSTVASLSSWKCEKPKNKAELKKSENGSSDMEGSQIAQRNALVQGLKRKLTAAVLSLPKPDSSKTSSSSSRSGSKTVKKRTCDRCSNRLDSNRQYKEHLTLVDEAVGDLKDHNQSLRVFLPKKRKAAASSLPPVQVKPVFQQDEPDESSFLSLSSDSDEDMPTADGASSPQKTEAQSSGASAAAGAVNCRCRVCGDSFDSMAVLNFHIIKKHTRKVGPME